MPWAIIGKYETLVKLEVLPLRARSDKFREKRQSGEGARAVSVVIDPETAVQLRQIADEDQTRALSEDLLRKVVWPLMKAVQSLINQNPEAAERGLTVQVRVEAQRVHGEFLTTAEVARRFRVSQQQVRRWCEQGLIQAERTPGGTWRIPADVAFLPISKARRPRDVRTVAGVWKDRPDLVRAALEQAEDD